MKRILGIVILTGFLGLVSALQLPMFTRLMVRAVTAVQSQVDLFNAPETSLTADSAYFQSVELLSDGRQGEAEALINSALKRYQGDTRIVFAKAVLRRSRWVLPEAALWFRRCSGDPAYLAEAAKITLALDRYEDIAANIKALIRLSDDHPDDIYLLWLTAIQCREHDLGPLGRDRFELLLKKFRTGPVMVHHTYANILTEDLQDYKKAMEHRRIVISMSSRDWALQGLANTLTQMGENLEALPVWKQLVDMAPEDDRYWHRYGSVLERLDRFSEAVPAFQKTVELDPTDDYAWMHLGLCLSMLERYNEAFDCYMRAMKLEGDINPFMMGNHLLKSGKGRSSYHSIHARQAVVECYLLGRGVEKNPELARRYCGGTSESLEQYVEETLRLAESMAGMDVMSHSAGAIKFADGSQMMTSCNALDVMVAVCEAAGRIDLAVETQKRLVTRCTSISTDEAVLRIQNERLNRLERP